MRLRTNGYVKLGTREEEGSLTHTHRERERDREREREREPMNCHKVGEPTL